MATDGIEFGTGAVGALSYVISNFKLIKKNRIELLHLVHKMTQNPHTLKQTTLNNRRQKLQAKFNEFLQKTPIDVSTLNLQDPCIDEVLEDDDWELEDCDSIEDENDSDEESDEEEDLVDIQPERLKLPLPSSLGQAICSTNDWKSMVKQEIDLRVAQAYECLDKLRLAIGFKSALFQQRSKQVKSQRTKTRLWHQVHQVNHNIQNLARLYQRSRNALVQLEAHSSILKPLMELQKGDLKLVKDITDANRVGQRDNNISWIWRVGSAVGDSGSAWMEEGRSITISSMFTFQSL
jgi:exonuclease VII large subunit